MPGEIEGSYCTIQLGSNIGTISSYITALNGITHQILHFLLKTYHKMWCFSESSIEPYHKSQQITSSLLSHLEIERLNAVFKPISYLGTLTLT